MRKLTLTLLLFAACQVPLLHANLVIATSSCDGSPDPTILCFQPPSASFTVFGNILDASLNNQNHTHGQGNTNLDGSFSATADDHVAIYTYVTITGASGAGTLRYGGTPVYETDCNCTGATENQTLLSNFAQFEPIGLTTPGTVALSFTFGTPFLLYMDNSVSANATNPSFTFDFITSLHADLVPYDSNGNLVSGASISIAAAPEPSTYAFAGSGILALVMASRRRSMARQSV